MKSIRRALILRLLVGLFALFTALGGVLYAVFADRLAAQFDETLVSNARLLSLQIEVEGDGSIEVEFEQHAPPETHGPQASMYYELVHENGTILARSPSLGDQKNLSVQLGNADATFADLTLPNGDPVRVFVFPFRPTIDYEHDGASLQTVPKLVTVPLLRLILAHSRSTLDRSLQEVLWTIVVGGCLLLIAAALIVRRSVIAGLRPLEKVGEMAGTIDANSLDIRFPETGIPQELEVICTRLNRLLARLQESFARERRFSSDVAHELRTPIAELRALAEVTLKWPDDKDNLEKTVQAGLEIALQMELIISQLLDLARTQEGRLEVALQDLDLGALGSECWKPFERIAERRGVRVNWTLGARAATADLRVQSDRGLLAQILTNLFSNAVEYAPQGGVIDVSTAVRGGAVELEVANRADDLSAEDLPHLFEPFWRKDAARSDREHVGLGLSLVQVLANALDVQVTSTLSEAQHFAVTVRFPPTSRQDSVMLAT